MHDFVIWYLLITLVGWAAFPLAFRWLRFLPDRGVTLLRPLGLLLASYLFWLLASLQVLQNTSGGVLAGLIGVAGLSFFSGRGQWADLREWFSANRRWILGVEGLFLIVFSLWAIVRAANPDVQYTETSMEMGFISSILRSEHFPPRDPWLSGYSISYYYFGYVMVAFLARLGGTDASIAFNLGHALWFAMAAVGAYGIVRNLLVRWYRGEGERSQASLSLWALLGPLFVLVVSNLEAFLAMLHARGLFWSPGPDGALQSRFWAWLNIADLVDPPAQPFGWMPHPGGGWPWWRASRVLSDFRFGNLTDRVEVIDEFPFFSYLLGDLHPHVLSMPFVLLAVGLALNLYLSGRNWFQERNITWIDLLSQPFFWLAAVVLGGLAFLNTWDFPIYVALFSAAYALLRAQQFQMGAPRWAWLGDFLRLAVLTGLAGAALYLPFYLGFSSQAGGILPSIAFFTPGKNFWVMFATLLLPVLAWLVARWREDGGASRLRQGGLFALAVVGGLWLLSYLYGFLISNLGAIGGALQRTPALVALGDRAIQAYNAFLSTQGVPTGQAGFLLLGSVGNRLSSPGTWLTLVIFLVLTWGLLTAFRRGGISRAQVRYEEQVLGSQTAAEDFRASGFVLLLILLGLGLALFPEFFYLRDFFGARMNTIFKFYYQAWILLALAAAYGSAVLLRSLRGAGGGLFRLGWVILILAGLVFPVTMLPRKTSDFRPVAWTLDGSLHLRRANPDVGAAIDWLKQAPVGVLAEGVTLSYDYGRLRYSIFSGQPAVIGWPFHEQQWGRTTEIGTREDDMRRLYTTRNWEEARQILQRYEVRYVIVGPNEFSLYNRADMGLSLQVEKFDTFLTPVFQSPSVTIYEVPLAALE